MPTQPHLIASAGDAAGLSRDLRLAWAKDGANAPLAPAIPIDGSAMLDVTQSVSQVAGRGRRALDLLRRCWRGFQKQYQRHRLRKALSDLSDRDLQDIGLTRGEIECIAAHRAIDRLRGRTNDPWIQF